MLSSLSNRIFLASALLAVLSIGTALFLVNVVVTRQAEAELEENLLEAGELVTQFQSLFFATLLTEARIVADVSRLKAAVDTRHPPTVRPLAEEYREALQADLVVVTHRNGNVLAVIGEPGLTPAQLVDQRIVKAALAGRSAVDVWSEGSGLLQVVSVPIFIDPLQPQVLGTLTAGLRLDRALADRIKTITRSDVVFVDGGRPRGSTLPADVTAALLAVPDDGRLLRATVDGEEYEAVRRRLVIEAPGTMRSRTGPDVGGPLAIVARSRTAHLAFLRNLHSALGATTAVAVLVATLLSFAVARTVTRPIRALTATMREMATTGVLTAPAEPPKPTPWDDEDARLLTGTFHALAGSLDRFQREAAQRERLSSLGRLSTVIAHEIRNPLMIIKGSVRSLRRGVATPEEVAGVAADIDGEVTRLNRVVNDVLDYAKPIALTYDVVEIDRLVRDAAQAVIASQNGPPDVVVEAAVGVTATTDGDRLRQVVINLVTNARDAVLARRPDTVAGATAADADADALQTAPPPIRVGAQLAGDDHVEISVADRGVGMSDVEVARMFEPFFTTKRRGSGIGLAIAKNIVDGLGGRIDVESQPGAGTTIRLTLPRSRQA
jgi:signal transduction histidine kinase